MEEIVDKIVGHEMFSFTIASCSIIKLQYDEKSEIQRHSL